MLLCCGFVSGMVTNWLHVSVSCVFRFVLGGSGDIGAGGFHSSNVMRLPDGVSSACGVEVCVGMPR